MELRLERVLPAAAPAVYEAFTDPAQLSRWWGPQGFTIPSLDFEPRAGATYRIEMQPPEGEPFHLAGEFREVDPPRRLAFTFRWEDPDPDDVENVADLTFEKDQPGSTRVTLVQGPFRTEDRRALHHDGWTDSFDKLEELLSRAGR
jgi:uncharacterized protein YndB with AHSA1/START domain